LVLLHQGKRTKTFKVFFSFFCGKKRNKKSQPGTMTARSRRGISI